LRFDLKELAEAFEAQGLPSIEAFSAAEESVTYGTNCFDLVFSDEPYVALRVYYDNLNKKLIPVVIRIMVKKGKHELKKEALEAILPALISAEEDQEVILIAARPPAAESLKEMFELMKSLATSIRKLVGEGEASFLGYVPSDCAKFL